MPAERNFGGRFPAVGIQALYQSINRDSCCAADSVYAGRRNEISGQPVAETVTPRRHRVARTRRTNLAGLWLKKPCIRSVGNKHPPASRVASWTDDALARAIREGIRPDGSVIGPPMPIVPSAIHLWVKRGRNAIRTLALAGSSFTALGERQLPQI